VVRPGARSEALLERYGLKGKTVLMTLGRLVSVERYKGFDEALDVLPDIATQLPNVAYLVVGDGSDRARLEEKAARSAWPTASCSRATSPKRKRPITTGSRTST
jgi:glycosyltransferase involved in cell wall biosynthesis